MKTLVILILFAPFIFNLFAKQTIHDEEKIQEFYHQILSELENAIEYTQIEYNYIKTHKKINICLKSNIFPYDGYIDNVHTGISADLFSLISKKSGLEFIPIYTNSSSQIISKIKSKECKLLTVINKESVNQQLLTSSIPFYKTYFNIISSIDKSFVTDISSLKDKVLLVNDKHYRNYILKLYPYLKIKIEKNIDTMMKKVVENKAYGAIALNESSDYLIQNYDYGKLKINAFLAKNNRPSMSIGVAVDEPLLLSIINKTLSSISPKKIENIVDTWHLTRYHDKTNYSIIIYIAVSMFLILLMMAFYQRKLKEFNTRLENEVNVKTSELRKLNESLELAVEQKIKELIKKDKILTVQSKQAVMGEMITMIAHQWRQPLSNITLLISNMQIEKLINDKYDEEKYDNLISNISESITYLADTIDDFQTFFQPDRVATKITPINFFDKVINLIAPRIKEQNVKLKINSDYDKPINIFVNELVQVTLNLLNNAIDAFDGLDVEKVIYIHIRENGDDLCIAISDNGCGIPQDIMKNLFDPYFSTKGKNGTGLGLYMSQMIMQKQFNGTIDVESSKEGTTFTIKLPKHLY